MSKGQQTLFDATPYEITPEFTKQEKTKWTKEFNKFVEKQYIEDDGRYSRWICGYMEICDLCKMEMAQGCKQCVKSIKTWYKVHHKKINYRDFDFAKIMSEIEGVEWLE